MNIISYIICISFQDRNAKRQAKYNQQATRDTGKIQQHARGNTWREHGKETNA